MAFDLLAVGRLEQFDSAGVLGDVLTGHADLPAQGGCVRARGVVANRWFVAGFLGTFALCAGVATRFR
jgi:hypothetical protein